jgi:hypothetical protein
MSSNSSDNTPFIKTIKELPAKIVDLGYSPIDPRIINSRTGVYMILIAIFRLPEAHDNMEFFSYITNKIGNELEIDPYEMVNPTSYVDSTVAEKITYRTNSDSRAIALLNELVSDCKGINREIKTLSHDPAFSEKVERVIDKAYSTFKRLVSLKEFSFGGAYLLDEDIYEQLNEFEKRLSSLTILSKEFEEYSKVLESKTFVNEVLTNLKRLDALTIEEYQEIFVVAHGNMASLSQLVNRMILELSAAVEPLKESINFSIEFAKKVSKSSVKFDSSAFKELPTLINGVISEFEIDIKNITAKFAALYGSYNSLIPESIKDETSINPDLLKGECRKFGTAFNEIVNECQKYSNFDYQREFIGSMNSIKSFYNSITKLYNKNRAFTESVNKSFKIKKRVLPE